MVRFLEAEITGSDQGLENALGNVRDAANEAAGALENVEESVSSIASDMEVAADATERMQESLHDVGESGKVASSGVSSAERSAQDLTIKASTLNVVVDEMSEGMIQAAGAAGVLADQEDQVEEQAQEATGAISRLKGAIFGESAAAASSVGPNQAAAQSLNNVEEEAQDATRAMAGTASMAELLSLQSSALSINVGAFTIALRNLTTQIPLLVASLGNLSTAFLGLAGAISAVGVGGIAVALGGAVAEMEELAGKGASMERKMQAMQAIGQEFVDMLREAIDPLVSMEGAGDVFISLLEEIATTVRVFSEAIAESFEDGPLANALGIISDAWMDSVGDIAAAVQEMVAVIGVPIAEVIAGAIRSFDDFIIFLTNATNDMMNIFGVAGENISSFIRELMLLGRVIAAGLAPVLSAFFDIVGDVADALIVTNAEIEQFRGTAEGAGASVQEAADALHGFRIGTIATGVQVIALGLAVNRLAGIMGGALQPMALIVGRLLAIRKAADSMSEAFLRVSGNVVAGVSNMSSGFGALVGSIQTMLPFVSKGESDLLNLANKMDGTNAPIARLRSSLAGLSSSLSLSSGAMLGFGEAADTADDDVGFLATKISALRSRLGNLVTFEAPDLGNAFRSMGDDIGEGDIISPMAIRRGLPDFEQFQVGQQLQLIDQRGAQQSLTGLSAIRQRLVMFRDNTLARMQNLNTAFFNRLIGLRDSIRNAGGGITGAMSVLRSGIADRVSSIRNTLSGLSLSGLLPSMDGSMVDQLMRPFNRLSNLDIEGFVARPFERLSSLNIAGAVHAPFERLNNLNIRGKVSGIRSTLSGIPGVISGVRLSLEQMRDGINNAIGSLSQLSFSSIASALRLELLRDRVDEVDDEMRGLWGRIVALIPATELLDASFQDLTDRMAGSSITAIRRLGQSLARVGAIMRGSIGITAGLRSAYAALVGQQATASVGQLAYATATTVASAATALLSGGLSVLLSLLGSLAVITGVAVAALGAFVLIAGSVSAVLMSIGESGQSAEDIIKGLRDTFMDIVDTLMPLFVASGNMMIDIFNSIMAPINELTSGLADMATALGFMEQGAGSSMGAMDMLQAGVSRIVPIVQGIGDIFRQVFGRLAGFIRVGMDALQDFLVQIDAGDKVREYADTLRSLGQQAMGLVGPIMDFVDVLGGVFMDVIDNAISSTMEVIDAFAGALGLGGGGDFFSGFLASMEGIYNFIIGNVEPALNLLGSIFGALGGLANVLIDVLAGGFKAIAGVLGAVIDLTVAFVEGLTGQNIDAIISGIVGGFSMLAGFVGPIMNGLAGVIDALVVMGDVGMTFLGEIFGLITNVGSYIADILMPIVRLIGGIFRVVFSTIIGIVTGTIDTIVRYFQTLWDMVNMIISGNIMGAFDRLVQFVMTTFGNLISFITGIFGDLGTIIWNALSGIVQTVIDGFMSIPETLVGAFETIGASLVNAISGVWNEHLAGDLFTISVPDWVPEIGGSEWTMDIPRIAQNAPSPERQGSGASPDVEIEDSTLGSEDLSEGVGTAADVGTEAASQAGMGGAPGNINYDEGDTNNHYNQNIQADPEEKGKLSRAVKDAIEEANSFNRRQQGHGG